MINKGLRLRGDPDPIHTLRHSSSLLSIFKNVYFCPFGLRNSAPTSSSSSYPSCFTTSSTPLDMGGLLRSPSADGIATHVYCVVVDSIRFYYPPPPSPHQGRPMIYLALKMSSLMKIRNSWKFIK